MDTLCLHYPPSHPPSSSSSYSLRRPFPFPLHPSISFAHLLRPVLHSDSTPLRFRFLFFLFFTLVCFLIFFLFIFQPTLRLPSSSSSLSSPYSFYFHGFCVLFLLLLVCLLFF